MECTYSIFEIEKTAQKILEVAKHKTILFYGPMGAGKTTLVKALLNELGSQDQASSPTFALVNEYETEDLPVFHFDFYRIEDETEALDMGFEDYLDQNAWIFIEWPEKIKNLLPPNCHILNISIEDEKKEC